MNNQKILLLLCMAGLFIGCKKESNENFGADIAQKKRYIRDHKAKYSDILGEVKDQLITSCEEDIWNLQSYCDTNYFKVDELIFFNSNKTRLVGVIKVHEKVKNSEVDYLKGYQGVKINDKWYFFPGANIILLREGYHFDVYEPLSWEELDYLAYTQYMRKFCKIENGNIVPFEDGIDKFARLRKGLKYPDGETDENRIAEYERSRKKRLQPKKKQ